MIIKHDRSYISAISFELMNRGYAELSVHSIHFDRHYNDEEKKRNSETYASMTREEWGVHCDQIAESFVVPMSEILQRFAGKYDIHQVSPEKSTMEHYRSNWDLYCNRRGMRGYDGLHRFESFTLTFNDKRTPAENKKLLEEILRMVEGLEYKNIACRVQYSAYLYQEKIEEAAAIAFDSLNGKLINYLGSSGKIRLVGEYKGKKKYGFFEKYAKKVYTKMDCVDILALTFT